MSKNTIVRGMLVPSLKNKPLDGRMDVPTLADIAKIENPYVNFIFPVTETGKWYKVVSLKDKVIDELTIPNGQVDKYELFGEGLTDEEKEQFLTKIQAEQSYLSKDEAEQSYLSKDEAEEEYQPRGDYATKSDLEEAGSVDYKELGDIDLDGIIDEDGVTYEELGEAPYVDFDSLK